MSQNTNKTKPRTTNKQPTTTTKKQSSTTTKPRTTATKKQQRQDDLDQRFLSPLLRVAIEPEARRRETEPGWTAIDRLGELRRYEGYYERCEKVEDKDK